MNEIDSNSEEPDPPCSSVPSVFDFSSQAAAL